MWKTEIQYIKNEPRADYCTGLICVNSAIYRGQLKLRQNIILLLYLLEFQIIAAYMSFNLTFCLNCIFQIPGFADNVSRCLKRPLKKISQTIRLSNIKFMQNKLELQNERRKFACLSWYTIASFPTRFFPGSKISQEKLNSFLMAVMCALGY